MRQEEIEKRCGQARALVNKFLKMPPEERDLMQDAEKTEIALAFQHIEMCWQGRNMPNYCNELWKKLRTMTWERDESGDQSAEYDPGVVRYLAFARCPFENIEGTEDNPLKKLE